MKITRQSQSKDLLLDGVIIGSLEELREHPSTELLEVHRNGSLSKWLRLHEAHEQADALNVITLTGDMASDLVQLCEILDIDVDIDDIKACLSKLEESQTGLVEYIQEDTSLNKDAELSSIAQKFTNMTKSFQQIIKKTDEYKLTRTVTHKSDDDDDDEDVSSIALLRDYKVIPDVNEYGAFDDHALALIDSGQEFNCPHISVPFVVRDVDNFLLDSVSSELFIVRAKNVFISDISKYCYSMQFIIIAENVYIGERFCVPEANANKNGLIICKNKFAAPVNYDRFNVPFDADLKTLHALYRNDNLKPCVSSDPTNIMLGSMLGLAQTMFSMLGNHPTDLSGITICAKQLATHPGYKAKFLPSTWADDIYTTLSDSLDKWLGKTSLFDPS